MMMHMTIVGLAFWFLLLWIDISWSVYNDFIIKDLNLNNILQTYKSMKTWEEKRNTIMQNNGNLEE